MSHIYVTSPEQAEYLITNWHNWFKKDDTIILKSSCYNKLDEETQCMAHLRGIRIAPDKLTEWEVWQSQL